MNKIIVYLLSRWFSGKMLLNAFGLKMDARYTRFNGIDGWSLRIKSTKEQRTNTTTTYINNVDFSVDTDSKDFNIDDYGDFRK